VIKDVGAVCSWVGDRRLGWVGDLVVVIDPTLGLHLRRTVMRYPGVECLTWAIVRVFRIIDTSSTSIAWR